jgi:predicted alpha/beta hydrolase family esterase
MQKRIFIIHGWHGTPDKNWFPWLKTELEAQGYSVTVPQLPDTDAPRIEKWIPALAKAIGQADENTYFVGHSMGCQAITRYLETLPQGIKVGGVVFVAGFFKSLTNIEDVATKHHWLEAPINFNEVRSHLPKSIALFSTNDPWVPLENKDDFKNKLGSAVIVKDQMEHFNWQDGTDRLLVVLDIVIKILN